MPPLEAVDNEKILVWPDLVYTELICMVVVTAVLIFWGIGHDNSFLVIIPVGHALLPVFILSITIRTIWFRTTRITTMYVVKDIVIADKILFFNVFITTIFISETIIIFFVGNLTYFEVFFDFKFSSKHRLIGFSITVTNFILGIVFWKFFNRVVGECFI